MPNPFFRSFESAASNTIVHEGQTLVDFSNYNYLGLAADQRVLEAARCALEKYGSSVSASRVVSGERPLHTELEAEIATLVGTEAALVFLSGFGTNASTVGHLFGPRDLILYDAYAHASVREGIKLSRAKAVEVPHNDMDALEKALKEHRGSAAQALIAVEGLYSMDGDVCDLPTLIEIKERYDAVLMIDEAHSIGVLGENGRGVAEHFTIDPNKVDLWMGTLSKSFASCGGYLAASQEVIDYLKFNVPAFVFSVGLPPASAAAATEAIRILKKEPARARQLQHIGQRTLEAAKARGMDTGPSQGFAVTPVITGNSVQTVAAGQALFEAGFNVLPILYPAVPENETRLRFFLTALHTPDQVDEAMTLLGDELRSA